MWKVRKLWRSAWFRIPVGCLLALAGGYLITLGRIGGVASPLAAVLVGACPPFYGLFILAGAMVACILHAPFGMYFALASLVSVLSVRILFYEVRRPHVLAVLSAMASVAGSAAVEFLFQAEHGKFPLFVLASLLIGAAVYFLSDAAAHLQKNGRITLGAGSSFTFAMVYLFGITALCGLDNDFCNAGRLVGTAVTLLAARHFRQSGGTLCGALTACGAVLCSVSLGQPLLFLPVTAMLAGFLHRLPNPLFIPVFFVMQTMSAAVLDGSGELVRIVIELLLACMLYALCTKETLLRMIDLRPDDGEGRGVLARREQLLSETLDTLRSDAAALIRHLPPAIVPDAAACIRSRLCDGCKNEQFCWVQREKETTDAFRRILHYPERHAIPEALDSCIRRSRMTSVCMQYAHHASLSHHREAVISRSRSTMLSSLGLLSEMTAAGARRRDLSLCEKETDIFKRIAASCGCQDAVCTVYRLKSGRLAAELYAQDAADAAPVIALMLEEALEVPVSSIPLQKNEKGMHLCFYEQPPFTMECAADCQCAPGFRRCGDAFRSFTDGWGHGWLVLSDGMGSGNAAALSSTLAVRSFGRLIRSGMEPECAIRILHMLLAELYDEHFATLDVLRLDGDSGTLTLYKCGAAPTLFAHDGRVRSIGGQSFPLGMLPEYCTFTQTLTAAPGDRVLMLSDGIPEDIHPVLARRMRMEGTADELLRVMTSDAAVSALHPDDRTMAIITIHHASAAAADEPQMEPDFTQPSAKSVCEQCTNEPV